MRFFLSLPPSPAPPHPPATRLPHWAPALGRLSQCAMISLVSPRPCFSLRSSLSWLPLSASHLLVLPEPFALLCMVGLAVGSAGATGTPGSRVGLGLEWGAAVLSPPAASLRAHPGQVEGGRATSEARGRRWGQPSEPTLRTPCVSGVSSHDRLIPGVGGAGEWEEQTLGLWGFLSQQMRFSPLELLWRACRAQTAGSTLGLAYRGRVGPSGHQLQGACPPRSPLPLPPAVPTAAGQVPPALLLAPVEGRAYHGAIPSPWPGALCRPELPSLSPSPQHQPLYSRGRPCKGCASRRARGDRRMLAERTD